MPKKIPTILGIVLTLALVAGLAFITSQVQKVTGLTSQAGASELPRDPGVGNLTDKSFTVFWLTDKEGTGSVIWDGGTAIDEGGGNTHLARINGLKPGQKYSYKIGDETTSREITTLVSFNLPTTNPIFGKVTDSASLPASGVLVVWEASDSGKIVTLSKSDGAYVLPVPPIAQNTPETITFDDGLGNKSSVNCLAGQDQPLPVVRLGKDLDCSAQATPTAQPGFKVPAVTINISDGQKVSTPLPTISGRAGPNQVVKIEVHSETPYSGTVLADPAGNWSWTPPANLSPGQHTVTITVQQADGTTQTITRTFFVSADQPILPITSGTPSATPTPIPTPETTPIPTITVTPTPEPTPPITGNTETSLFLLTAGILFATMGVWINQLSKNQR